MQEIAEKTRVQVTEAGSLACDLMAEGCVVSVSDKAVNIRISTGLMISLVRDAHAMTPMSIRCPEIPAAREGDRAEIDCRCLRINDLVLDMIPAEIFRGLPCPKPLPLPGRERMIRFETLLGLLGKSGGMLDLIVPGNAGRAVNDPGRKLMAGLVRLIRLIRGSRAQAARALEGFVGLGPGLTPSGDDLIMGFLLGDGIFGPGSGRPGRERENRGCSAFYLTQKERERLLRAAAHTSDSGRTLIHMALKGAFPRYIRDAARDLFDVGREKMMSRTIAAAVQHGHTSGTDALTGLLLYIRRALYQKCAGPGNAIG